MKVLASFLWALSVRLVCVTASLAEDSKIVTDGSGKQRTSVQKRFSTFHIRRTDLNKPISGFNVHFQLLTTGSRHDRAITCVILRNQPISASPTKLQDQLSKQLIPTSYAWVILDQNKKVERRWLARFLQNRDGTFLTHVSLPREDFSRSQLEIYFEDIDEDGEREDITFVVDLSEFDWNSTSKEITQGAK